MKYALCGKSRIMIFFLNTLAYILSFAAPFALFEVNYNHRPIDPRYIINLNAECSKNLSAMDL